MPVSRRRSFPTKTTNMDHAVGVSGTINNVSYSGEGVTGVANLDYSGADDPLGQVVGVEGMLWPELRHRLLRTWLRCKGRY